MIKLFTKLLAFTLVLTVSFGGIRAFAADEEQLENAEKSALNGAFGQTEEITFSEEFIDKAGTPSSDWLVIALNQLGVEGDFDKYRSALSAYVIQKYETENKLDVVKSTEWHRITLAYLACGGDPTDIDGINIAKDGVTLRDFERQGLSAYIWGLIAMDAANVESEDKRRELVDALVKSQLDDGGFTLFGNSGDPDVTAMVIIALSPYAEEEKISKTIETAVSFLSENQLENGGFMSYGVENCESCAQAVIALCSVGIDPDNDERFVKNGISVVDTMLKYEIKDLGFCHVKSDSEINGMATQQALLAIAALKKYEAGERLYTFNNEQETNALEFSNEDRELVRQFSTETHASDIKTLERLLQTLEQAKPDDYDVIKIALSSAISKAEELREEITQLDKEIYKLYNSGVGIGDKDKIEDLEERYNSINDKDKSLVTNAGSLEEMRARVNSETRRIIIAVSLIVVVVACGVILVKTKKKYDL